MQLVQQYSVVDMIEKILDSGITFFAIKGLSGKYYYDFHMKKEFFTSYSVAEGFEMAIKKGWITL